MGRVKNGLLKELPAPPTGREGWPWTTECDPKKYQHSVEWPSLCVIVPSFNRGPEIEHVLRSVLLQNYPQTELIIIDGGSTDNTLEIINKYKNWITFWQSKVDKGIYDAMNIGIAKSKSDWLYFIGTDDIIYDEHVFYSVFENNKFLNSDIIYGNVYWERINDSYDGEFTVNKLIRKNICHQSIFFNRKVFNIIGCFDTSYSAHADWLHNFLWFIDDKIRVQYVNKTIAKFAPGGFSSQAKDGFVQNRFEIFFNNGRKKMSLEDLVLVTEEIYIQKRKVKERLSFIYYYFLFLFFRVKRKIYDL